MANKNPVWQSFVATIILACGSAGFIHHIKLAMAAEGTAEAMSAFTPGLMYLIVGAGLASLLVRQNSGTTTAQPSSSATATNGQEELLSAVESLTYAVNELRSAVADRPQADATYATPQYSNDPQAESMARVVELLDENRELSMMSDAQRKSRFLQHSSRRKTLLLRQARNHIGANQFADAERIIEQCKSSYGNGDDVTDVGRQLQTARSSSVNVAIDNAGAQVEDLMALSRWDEAMAIADGVVHNHPDNEAAQALRDRVARERDVFRNVACQRLYDEIRQDVDHRDWRKALAGTQKLLERFGDLPRADKVRSTLRTIQDNAEIQERQDFEARIQDLIRSRRFSDAIELSDELIARFPDSPQAEKLRDLLPKLRERAVDEEASELVERRE